MGLESSKAQEEIRFLQFLTNDGAINAGVISSAFEDEDGVDYIGLQGLRSKFGNNFNTLIILNTGTVNMDIIVDGKTMTTVNANNGSFSFDWKDGIVYNDLRVKNIDGANALSDNGLRITVGRTGA